MRFARVDNKLTEAEAGLKGLCPGCFQPVIAKCGTQRIHHWAHVHTRTCDSWWETETHWHRSWKNNFAPEWQEVFLPDAVTGEKHIADVRTSRGLVIEFQHSHINPKERTAREMFYKDMVWVVDGARLTNDYKRFAKGISNFRRTTDKGIYLVSSPKECFPAAWLGSSVPVIFDFRDAEPIGNTAEVRNFIYLLFPKRIGRDAIAVAMLPKFFIQNTINGEWAKLINNLDKAWQYQINKQQGQKGNMWFANLTKELQSQRLRRRL